MSCVRDASEWGSTPNRGVPTLCRRQTTHAASVAGNCHDPTSTEMPVLRETRTAVPVARPRRYPIHIECPHCGWAWRALPPELVDGTAPWNTHGHPQARLAASWAALKPREVTNA